VALGTDSAGSIRIPAACCGVVGFKPTHGLVPLEGCFPLAPSFDVGGPMARSAADCERALAALVPGWDPASLSALADVSVGVAWLADADPGVAARVAAAAERFPARREVDFPHQPEGIGAVFMQEVADVHRDLFAEHAEAYSANVRAKVERCLSVGPGAVAAGRDAREAYREQAGRALAGCDLLLVPTIGTVAPRRTIPEPDLRPSVLRFTYPLNSLGWPALALPCGPAEDGLPASVTLAGPAGSDALVLAAGILLEEALNR